MTTIARRVGHIGLTFIGFGDRLFADGTITINDVEFARSAAAAIAFLNSTYHGREIKATPARTSPHEPLSRPRGRC